MLRPQPQNIGGPDMRPTTALPGKVVAAVLAVTLGAMTGLVSPAVASGPAHTWHPSTLNKHKAITVQVLKRLFEDGDVSVVDRYIRPGYIQHNPLAPNG